MEIETEEEVQYVTDARRHQVMMPERDTASRPKRPVSASDARPPSVRPSSADYGQDAGRISRHSQSHTENVQRQTKLKVC